MRWGGERQRNAGDGNTIQVRNKIHKIPGTHLYDGLLAPYLGRPLPRGQNCKRTGVKRARKIQRAASTITPDWLNINGSFRQNGGIQTPDWLNLNGPFCQNGGIQTPRLDQSQRLFPPKRGTLNPRPAQSQRLFPQNGGIRLAIGASARCAPLLLPQRQILHRFLPGGICILRRLHNISHRQNIHNIHEV